MEQLFYIGSYSKEGGYFPDINGEGITLCSLDLKTGRLVKKSSYPEAVNATYLTKYGDDILLVASDQYEEPGNIMSFSIGAGGALKQLSTQSTQGTATCHVSANEAGNQVFVASYMNGRLSVHSIKDGKLSFAKHVYSYEGQGPNTDRQERSHAHCAKVSPSGKWLYVCDLGSDKIWLHNTARLTGELSEVIGIEVPSGYGPRHLEFNPDNGMAYLICELNAHLLTYTLDDSTGMLTLVNDSPTLPDDYNEVPSVAAIRLHPSGKTLYVSNRNHNSIVAFSMDAQSGLPTFESRFMTHGDEPRDFNIDPSGKWLVVANQYGNSVLSFELDEKNGLPTGNTGSTLKCGSPVCVLF